MKLCTTLFSVVVVAALVMLGGCKAEEEAPASSEGTPSAAAPETPASGVPAAISAKFTEGSCCDKAEKDGKACAHPCCVEAVAAGNACEKCNKT